MNAIMQTLLKLQAIEFDEVPAKTPAGEVERLRGLVPIQILGHYDRLVVRGKKGVAVVRNQVCSGCQMRLPIGTINDLMKGDDIRLCDTCGRYLYLPPVVESTAAPAAVEAKPAPKATPKPRKRKPAAHAVA